MHALLVANPHAGRVRGPAGVARVVSALEAVGFTVEPVAAADGDAVPEALRTALRGRDPGDTRVIVAGGDGTIRGVLPALANTPFSLAVLPVGSVNVLAREFDLPRDLTQAAQVAAGSALHRLDLGMADGRPFALTIGLGFDAAVVHAVRPGLKRLLGVLTYVTQGLALLPHYPGAHFRITADEAVLEQPAWLAVVTNLSRYTYGWRICPGAAPDDGWLDLCLFTADSFRRRLGQVLGVLRGSHADYPGVRHLRARRFHFACDPPVPVQLDGDPAGLSPTEVTLAPQALTLVVPGSS